MKNYNAFMTGMLVLPLALLGLGIAFASSVTTPNTFSAGTVALAAQVNANFAAHAAAINDNDTRITNKASVEVNVDGGFTPIPDADSVVKELNSITITAPVAGRVHVTWSGNVVFFADGKSVNFAVADNNTAIPAGRVEIGRLDGAGTDRFQRAYAHQNVFTVAAGSHTFYGLAQGSTVFDTGGANATHGTLVATFIAD